MRSRSVLTALVVTAAGLAGSMVGHRLARRFAARAHHTAAVPTAAAQPLAEQPAEAAEAVVLAFSRPVAPAPIAPPVAGRPATQSRCGDSGGRTKSGAPCAARAAAGGRCHHHRLAA